MCSEPDTPAAAPPGDADLVARCQAGDAQAWAALVARYQRLVYAIVRRFGDDEHAAADVFQTVFARLLQHLPKLQQPERLQAWIVTTARREALLQRRIAGRTWSIDAAGGDGGDGPAWDLPDDAAGPEQSLDELQQWHALRRGLDALDERCRTLLGLLFADDDERLGYDAIGQRLGLPVGSIGPTRQRCLGKLRRLVQ